MHFYSYRDPHLDATLERFDEAAAWLRSFEPSADALNGYIISSVAGYDAPKKPRETARIQDAEFLGKVEPGWKARARTEVLNAEAAVVRDQADVLEGALCAGAACAFGNRAILESSKKGFELVDLLA